ncbi:MAG: hypothetical protein ACI4KM_10290 [Oscillospiraceae bacterium]
MTKEMTTAQYFCVSFDPAVVRMSVECFDEETGKNNIIENVEPESKYNFPFIIPRNNYLWISMAVNYNQGLPKKLNFGYVKVTFAAKTRSFEDADVKCGISYDCKTIQSVETLRQDCITFTVRDGKVDIQYSLQKPVTQTDKQPESFVSSKTNSTDVQSQTIQKPSLQKSSGKNEDILRDIYADLEILKYYAAHDADNSVFQSLKAAAETIESGGSISIESVYQAEEKLAEFITADTELLHRYKNDIE